MLAHSIRVLPASMLGSDLHGRHRVTQGSALLLWEKFFMKLYLATRKQVMKQGAVKVGGGGMVNDAITRVFVISKKTRKNNCIAIN